MEEHPPIVSPKLPTKENLYAAHQREGLLIGDLYVRMRQMRSELKNAMARRDAVTFEIMKLEGVTNAVK